MSQQTVLNGRYELHRRLARGGMADVYLARDQLLDRPVAVKVLFPEFATDPSFVARFRREAQAAANLTHPNIVSVYDWGEEGETYFIVMEYVEGRSLAEIIRTEGPLHPQRAADIAADIAAALGFAHRNGVVHRDIKPGNVLIAPTGQVKVADFGIARATDAAVEENLTQTGAVMGTATYFSPEQAQGLPLDPRSDLYALGVVLYEMVTGRPPYTGDNPVAIAYKHVQEKPAPPRSANGDVPPELEAIILRLLAKDPAHRYPSAEDLRADLRRFREGQPVTAIAAPIAATQAVPMAAGAGTQAVPVQSLPPDHQPPRRTGAFLAVLFLLLILLAGLLFALAQVLGDDNEPSVAQVAVPPVIGQTVEVATQTLDAAGFNVERIDEKNEDNDVGIVFAQEPDAGTKIDEGSTVKIHVSQGANTKPMPDVVGLQDAAARQLLVQLGFSDANVTSQPQNDETAPEGEVIDQIPAANSEVAVDAQITLIVSSGPAPRDVPDVSGKSVAEASNILGQAGFAVTQRDQPSDTVDAGRVISTDPAAGTTQPKGTTITLVVSSGPEQVTVPEVEGMSEAAATASLQAAGFVVDSSPVTVSDPLQDGLVQTQDPAGGQQATKGSTVSITIGKFEP
jgi:serine/threonine-protein kinase